MDIVWHHKFFPNEILAGTTTRNFGDVSIRDTINKQKLVERLDISPNRLVSLRQEHTVIIKEITMDSRLRGNDKGSGEIGDGLWTKEKGICLLVKTADCVPMLIWEEKKEMIMALHVGRINFGKGIIDKGIKILLRENAHPKNLKILLGPFIEKKCYSLDLEREIRKQLKHYKISDKQINSVRECTYCLNNKYFSYRRGDTERIGTFIMMK